MKRIYLLICIMFLFLFTTGCSMNEVNVNIRNVQESEIYFSVPSDTFSIETINALKSNSYTITQENNKLKISTIVSNVRLADNVNEQFIGFLEIIKTYDTEIYNQIKDYNFMIESSFSGYSFGGIESVNLSSSNIDKDFKINITGQDMIALNNGNVESKISLSSDDLQQSAFISYNMSSINDLKIKIIPKKDYKTIDATFEMQSSAPILDDMPTEQLVERGFIVDNQNESLLIITKNYENTETFNYLFNLDLINVFGLVGKVDIDYNLGLVKEVNVDAIFQKSELIDNVNLEVIIPKKGTETISNVSGTEFSWDIDKNFEARIESVNINYSSIIISLIIIVGITFVCMGMIIMKKRSSHILYK